MKMLLPLALATISLSFLNSCTTPELSMKGEQCSPVFVYTDETKKLIDADQSYCNVRIYEMSLYKIGAEPGTNHKEHISYCDRCVGFKKYSDWATFWEEVRRNLDETRSERIESFARAIEE